jgi:hypothetical protein
MVKAAQEDPNNGMMFRDCTEEVQQHLIELSCKGYIYIGRTGAGLTNDFRRSTFQHGTIKAIEDEKTFIGEVKAKILQLIAIEGPRWVSFKRIEDVYYGVKLPVPQRLREEIE